MSAEVPQTPSNPIPSATVLLLREAAAGFEVFMVVRHHQIDFASGALVFPGGKADQGDYDPALRTRTDGAAEGDDALAVQISAIRECFEECGVLLARPTGGQALLDAERLAGLDQFRKPLHDGSLKLRAFLEEQDLRLAADQLTRFAHWITPEMMPKRFDTHFFLVAAPKDQLAIHDGYESVDSVWLRPQQALEEAKSGKRTIIFPTLRNLERLGLSDQLADALRAAAEQPVVPVQPWTERRGETTYLCIPTDAGYPVCEEVMPARP